MLTSDTAQLIQRRTSNKKALITDLWGFGVNTGWLWVKASKRLLKNLRMALMSSAEAAISAPPLNTTPAANSIAIDEAFVVRLRGGDNDAWDEFVESYSPKLFAYLRYKLPTREDAEDVLNETFGAAVRAIHSFDGRASLLTWLAAIARNKIANYYKALPEPAEPDRWLRTCLRPSCTSAWSFERHWMLFRRTFGKYCCCGIGRGSTSARSRLRLRKPFSQPSSRNRRATNPR